MSRISCLSRFELYSVSLVKLSAQAIKNKPKVINKGPLNFLLKSTKLNLAFVCYRKQLKATAQFRFSWIQKTKRKGKILKCRLRF